MFLAISRVIEKAKKFETLSKTNIDQKLKPFLEVCDISTVNSPAAVEKSSPLSPKRTESPVVLEEGGRGKR